MAKRNNAESQRGAKDRVKRDNFFRRSKNSFKQHKTYIAKFNKRNDENDGAKNSFQQRKPVHGKFHKRNDGGDGFPQRKSFREKFKQCSTENDDSLKPSSSSSSNDFFVKKADSITLGNNKPENQKSQGDGNKRLTKSGSGSFFVRQTKGQKPEKPSTHDIEEKSEKKPFDKKKWRLQKYSKKYKLQQWEEKHKKTVMREYYKQIKHDKPNIDVQKIYEEADANSSDTEKNPEVAGTSDNSAIKEVSKNKRFMNIEDRFSQAKQEKEERKAAALQRKAEKEAALRAYKKQKLEKYKKLSQKTKKGQPIMKHRIDMLLEQIQKSVA